MQTANDTITSTLRIRRRDLSSATLIRDREKSTSFTRPTAEQVGYMLIGPSLSDDIIPLTIPSQPFVRTYNMAGQRVSSDHLSRGIYLLVHPNGSIHKLQITGR